MIHFVDLTIWVCLLVCKQRIPRATRELFNNQGDRGQVSLTMRSLGVNEPAQYTVSTKDGRMMIDAKGWSTFKSKSYPVVGDDVKIELLGKESSSKSTLKFFSSSTQLPN